MRGIKAHGSGGSGFPTYDQTATPSSPSSGEFWWDQNIDVLKRYDGAAWQWVGLDDLANVNTTGKADTNIVEWDTGTSEWVDVAKPSGGGGGGAAIDDRTLEFEDTTDDTTKITTVAGTVSYDATEDALAISGSSGFEYQQAATDVSALGSWFDIEFDMKGTSGLLHALAPFDYSAGLGFGTRTDFRVGSPRVHQMQKWTGVGSFAWAGGPRPDGPSISGAQGAGWFQCLLGRRDDVWFLSLRLWRDNMGLVTWQSWGDTTYDSGPIGFWSEVATTYVRNIRSYKYASDPT